ncbi:MAG: hypothetical protein UY76_C0039G0004 [Candidatus Uhrbacteria bacterium GW2011_GWA2_52_8d]|uniref:Small multi-drug export protein n=1 Tax=Candidatus Uhrbacteria bacterium GW2011_GWA2_52_8d TaxID=1618979 RepID=A0A0G1ZV12_9BACT|nr:MAG: hypothetical protein UY76_C0039G0004 [Candidatus Uhrbacteria bacterium GW2011_GWA2_52_8d]
MIDFLIQFFGGISPELASALLASLPVTELRAALPIALLVFELDPFTAYFWTVFGNLIPILLVYLILPPLMMFALRYTPRLNRRLETFFDVLKTKHGDRYSKWGAFFLFLFVAMPLPGTGVWTGTVLAVVFRIKPTLAISYIVAGLLVAGLLVLAITQGVFRGGTFL